jgi:hypothetical protein
MDTFEGDDFEPLSLHKYIYTVSDPVNRLDPTGLSGMLTIASDDRGPSSLALEVGHSWVVWQKDPVYTPQGFVMFSEQTYGTWGYDVDGFGAGLRAGLELQRFRGLMPFQSTTATRSTRIDDAAELRFQALRDSYSAKGSAAWQEWNNCAGFASDAWLSATGEDLAGYVTQEYYMPLVTPARLKEAIQKVNKSGYKKPGASIAARIAGWDPETPVNAYTSW